VVLGYTRPLIGYSVGYRFTTRTGQKIESDAKVSAEEWSDLDERGPIKVRYLPDDPQVSHVTGQLRNIGRMETILFTGLGAGFAALGGLMLFIMLRNDRTVQ